MKATYIDSMGTDLSVVNAAKVSFGASSSLDCPEELECCQQPEGCYGTLKDADKRLIQFLARGCSSGDWDAAMIDILHNHDLTPETREDMIKTLRNMPPHWSPFAHTALTLHLRMPIFVARQVMKHTTGLVYNEISRRYVDSVPEFYQPVWREKATNVKQGSGGELSEEKAHAVWSDYNRAEIAAFNTYMNMIDVDGVAPEQARMVLPQSMYTEVIMTGNLYSLATMFIQRTDSHAQRETQDLVRQFDPIIRPLFPVSWEALVGDTTT